MRALVERDITVYLDFFFQEIESIITFSIIRIYDAIGYYFNKVKERKD